MFSWLHWQKMKVTYTFFNSPEENPAFHEHSIVYQPYCRWEKKSKTNCINLNCSDNVCVKSLNIALILKLCSSDVYTGDKEGSILTQVIRSVKNVNVSLVIINLIESSIIRSKFDFLTRASHSMESIFSLDWWRTSLLTLTFLRRSRWGNIEFFVCCVILSIYILLFFISFCVC